MQKFSIFKRGLSSLVPPPAQLTVYVWHAGKFDKNRNNFIKTSQNEALLNINAKDDKKKIAHAACEIKIDFTHPSTYEEIIKRTVSALVYSEEYRAIKNKIKLTPKAQQTILDKYSKTSLKSLSLYLSLYPDDTDMNTPKIDYISKQMPPLLKDKELDFIERSDLSLAKVSLTNLSFEDVLSNLMEVLTFKVEEGVVVVDEMRRSNRYYLPDVFNEHFKEETDVKLGVNFACSTLITHILAAGLEENNYQALAKEAEKKLGHRNAYPEFVYTIADLARELPENNESFRPN